MHNYSLEEQADFVSQALGVVELIQVESYALQSRKTAEKLLTHAQLCKLTAIKTLAAELIDEFDANAVALENQVAANENARNSYRE